MKIKYRITFLFTLVVTAILFLVCASVYYFSSLNRENDFRRKLKNRALTTVNLLMRVQGIDKHLLKKIDESTFVSLQNKSVIIYNEQDSEVYKYTDENTLPTEATPEILLKAKTSNNPNYFIVNNKDAIAIQYKDAHNKYVVLAAASDENGIKKLSELRLILLLSFVSGILITAVSGLFFSTRLVLPIKKITNEVKEISSLNLSRRIDLHEPKDELYELASTFNKLLSSLQESFEIQRRFIANASHELSTPLTSISSQVEIVLQNPRSSEEYKEVLHSVYDDTKNMIELTRSLLELAKASGTSDGLDLTLVRVDEMLMRLPPAVKKTNEHNRVDLHFESFPDSDDKLLVFGNIDLLYSAVKNIVLNACKYSDNNQAIVTLAFTETELLIKIADDGPGIAEAERELIFQPFYRSQSAISTQGFGLGLSLALRIIKLHKGNINIDFNSNSKGTVFVISLPYGIHFHRL